MSEIDTVFQNTLDRCVIPHVRRTERPFIAEIVPVKDPILQRRNNTIPVEIKRDLTGRIALSRASEYALYNRRRHFIRDKKILISAVLAVTIRRAGTVQTILALVFQNIPDLP